MSEVVLDLGILKESIEAYNDITDGESLEISGHGNDLCLSEGLWYDSSACIHWGIRGENVILIISTSKKDENRILRKLLKGSAELRRRMEEEDEI